MDEKKKGAGRPTIYTGRENGYVKSERTERKPQEQSFAERGTGERTAEQEMKERGADRLASERKDAAGQKSADREAGKLAAEQKNMSRARSASGNVTRFETDRMPSQESTSGKSRRMQPQEQAGVPRRRQRGTEPEQADIPKKKRHREMETEARMRVLWSILGVLVAILIAAIIYEVVLGYGTKETGAERMEKMRQEKLLNVPESEEGRGTEASAGETEAGEPDSEAGEETEAR